MVSKYTFGNPFNTEAVITPIEASNSKVPYLDINPSGTITYTLDPKDVIYGLGEQVRGINKRGWQYVSWNYDNPHHHEDTRSLYGSHNFIVISGKITFGLFIDFPGEITWDIGYTKSSLLSIEITKPDFDLYIIEGPSIKDIVKSFRKIIGKSYIPPMWAFGYGQSRWGYKDESDVLTVANEYSKHGIPLDSIYMDIDYMDSYKDFTVDKSRFPDLKELASSMKSRGIHLVPIIDAGIKIEDGYDVYEEGVANNYFCKDENGDDFVGAVWPGRVHFPDFMNPSAREWFGLKYKALTSLGIDGFWNDMNEPAIFYSESSLKEALSEIKTLTSGKLAIDEYFRFVGLVDGLNGNKGDYSKFYHNVDGKMVNHALIHNLYGMNMTRSAYEALLKLEPDKKILFFSRSSYIGAHRYGGIWQGDNNSWWGHILQSMKQLPALNMAGFLFVGSDTGGFGCDTTEDLMLRWLQYSMFTPLFRNHSCDGTRYQELYQFSNVDTLGEMIKIRYSLIPYLYTTFIKAVNNDEMMFRPLSFDYSDKHSREVEDQLLIGDEIMIAPIYTQNASGRYVYLPEEMMLIRMKSWSSYETSILPKGHHYIEFPLDELVFFIRKGKAIALCDTSMNVEGIDYSTSRIVGYSGASYELYGE